MKLSLKALRANENMTQQDAANLIGVSKDAWFNWENGKSSPNAKNIDHILKAFNVNYDDVYFFDPKTRKTG